MPTYSYDVVIRSSLDTADIKSGGVEVERELTRIERQAEQTARRIAELQKNPAFKKGVDDQLREQARLLREQERRAFQSAKQQERFTQQRFLQEQRLAAQSARHHEQMAFRRFESERRHSDRAAREREQAARRAADAEIRENRRAAKEFEQAMRRQTQAQQKFERERAQSSRRMIRAGQTVGGGMQSAGMGMTAAVTVPVVAGFSKAIEIGVKYEESMNIFGEVTEATADEMKKADALAIKLGNDLTLPGVSAVDAAKAMTELGKAGMTASESMAAAKGTLQLATAANIDAGQAAEITANALNMFGLEAGEAGRVADLLAGAANASSAEITDVAASLQQAGAVFAGAKVPIEDVVTLIGEMANQGIKGSDAGTSLKTMMQRLQSPTDAAASTMKALNVAIYDQQGKMKPMRDIIGQFEKSLKGLTQQQKDQALNTIFGSDAVRAATIVFSEGVAGFDKMAEGVKRLNAAQELAAARSKGLGGAWNALKSQAETVGLIIFNRIKEPLTALVVFVATVVQKITDAFVALPEGVQQGILAFAALLAAIGPLLAIVGTLIVALGSVGSALMTLTGAATVGAALSALLPIIGGVIAVVAGLTAGIGLAIGAVYGLVEAWDKGFGPVASVVAIAVGAIMTAISPIIGLPVLLAAIGATVYKIWTTNFAGLRDFTIQVWDTIVGYVKFTLGKYLEIINAVGGRIIAWWRQNLPLMQQITTKVTVAIQGTIGRFLQWISDFWTAHGTKILGTVNWIWNNIKAYVMYGVNNVLDIITIVLKLINGQWSDAWQSVLKMTQRVTRFIVSAIWGFIKMVGEAIIKLNKWIYNNLGAIISKIASMVVTGLKYLVTIIAFLPLILIKLVPKFIAAGRDIGSAIWQGIKDGLTGSGESPPIDSFDINTVFADVPGFNPEAVTQSEPSFLDKLTNSMKDLGDATGNTNSQLGDFNKNLETGNKRSRETRENNRNRVNFQDLSLEEIMDAMRLGTASQESGGRSRIQNRRTRATGLFQVMPDNIPSWTRNTPGVGEMSIEEFRNNPAAQIKVFNKYMGEYLRQAMILARGNKELAVRMAAAAWYGGPDDFGSYDNPVRFKKDEPSYREYTTSVLRKTKRGVGRRNRGDFTDDKTMEQIADENNFNAAKSRVQELISLSRELNVALEVSTDVTTTNDALIQQQKTELKNLQDLKQKREDILEIVGRLGLKEEEFARANLVEADFSIARLKAVEDSQKFIESAYDASLKKLRELQAAAAGGGEILSPLQEFNTEVERMAAATGLSTEEFERLNPQLQETRENLQKIADIELANKVRENFKKFHQEITKEIDAINREIEISGIVDPTKRSQAERAAYIADYIEQNFADADFLTKLRVAAELMRKFAAQDMLDGIKKAAENTKTYEEKVKELNDALRGNIELTEMQKLENELTAGSLKGLTAEQKEHLRVLQQQVDVQREIDKYNEKVRQIGDAFGQVFADSFTALFTKGIDNALETLQKGLKNFFKNIWLNIVNQFAQRIQKSISDKIMDIFGIGGGNNSQSGGGFFGGLFNRGGNRTAQGATNFTGPQTVQFAGQAIGGGGGGTRPRIVLPIGENIPALTQNVQSTPLVGGGRRRNWSQIGGPGRLIQPWENNKRKFNLKNIFGKGGIFGEQGFGFNSGTIGTLGMLGGLAGSLIGGGAGSVLMGAASGIGLMSSLSSMLGISALGGPVGLAVGAAIGGVMALGSWLFGRNKQRRRDEKTREAAMKDAFEALDKLIADVNSDRIDGEQALSQADDIRRNYLEQMNQLKDKKTRRHALIDVARIDQKIQALKAAATAQKQRKERLTILSPTFAEGGSVSAFARNNFRNNPLGYIRGRGSSRSDSIGAFFPAANSFARISNTEYVLDADTVRNIGVSNLDLLRAGRGRNFAAVARMMRSNHQPPRLAAGGAVVSPTSQTGISSGGGNIELKAQTNVYITQDAGGNITSVRAETYLDTPQGKQKIEEIVEAKIYQNGRTGKIPVAIERTQK